MPAAEVGIDVQLVRRLLEEQRADLADRELSILSFGWDNVSVRVEPDLVARLPRRSAAVPLIANEARWLPVLADRLPLPVPVPIFVGQPGSGYPWPWSISGLIPGGPASLAPRLDLETCARQIGEFLLALHRRSPAEAPANPYRGVPLRDRDHTTRERLRSLAGVTDVVSLEHGWEVALAADAYPIGEPLWLHGDLHPHNLLAEGEVISGVVDFGDITGGDPATDLAIGWSLFTPRTRPLLWDSYGGLDGATLDRARGWAISLGSAYLANSADNATMASIGRRTLQQVVGDL